MIAQVCGFSYWSWLSGMLLGMWSWQQSKGRCELSTCDFWGTHERAQGWTPQVCHSQRPTGWPPAEVLKQTAGNTLLQSPFMLSASFPFLSLPQSQSFVLRNLGVGREKQVSPATTCTPGTAWNSLTTFAFYLLHGKGPHWHSQKPSHLQWCPGEGFPSWQIPSLFCIQTHLCPASVVCQILPSERLDLHKISHRWPRVSTQFCTLQISFLWSRWVKAGQAHQVSLIAPTEVLSAHFQKHVWVETFRVSWYNVQRHFCSIMDV